VEALEEETFTLYALRSSPWPINLQFNADAQGVISAIFIYRSDF